MPAAVKLRACRQVSGDFIAFLSAGLGAGGAIAAFREAARETGRKSGADLKRDLGLGSSFADAEIAWRIVSKASGMKFRVEPGEGRSIFRHSFCPMLSAGGQSLCEDFCLPMVEGLTEAICPACAVEVVESAGGKTPCVKALVSRSGPDVR